MNSVTVTVSKYGQYILYVFLYLIPIKYTTAHTFGWHKRSYTHAHMHTFGLPLKFGHSVRVFLVAVCAIIPNVSLTVPSVC